HLCVAWKLNHRSVESAAAALIELRKAASAGRPFDLLITDHHMPVSDGLDLATAIAAESTIPRPTLVLLTSRGERLPQTQLEQHGFAACELKPLHAKAFHETLTRVLATARPPAVSPVAPHATPPPAMNSQATSILIAEDNVVNQKVTLL